MIKYLSYKLAKKVPAYGVPDAEVEIREGKSIAKGDICNTFWFGMQNHWGTHVDCPAHFFDGGNTITDYSAGNWHFTQPQVLNVNLALGQILEKCDIEGKLDNSADLLILKSGWGGFREQNTYSMQNPGITPEVGIWLRKEYPLIRAIGFDWVSLSSYANRDIGREAHRAFLNPSGEGNPILIIEDMDLTENMEDLKEVWVFPLRVEGMDSAPCTILGVFK
jgi:kynurenine formamidase